IYMPRKKTREEMNFTYVECLLYNFHHLSHKTPNATNSVCGYTIVTGQPSNRIGRIFLRILKILLRAIFQSNWTEASAYYT
ncbi:hypothetical protein MKW94_028483, partial [Papaver nudicaule]|nr:hypothetical protein [Papaver nudicaule]